MDDSNFSCDPINILLCVIVGIGHKSTVKFKSFAQSNHHIYVIK